jgi:hypothetical protein
MRNEVIGVQALDVEHIYAENGPDILVATNEEIRLFTVDLRRIGEVCRH